jgi:hypothetical protein
MPTYNIGGFSINKDMVRVYDSFPDQRPFQQILLDGAFGSPKSSGKSWTLG